MRTASRRGFTLVELLVVISIISVLISLLLPAVQAARENARRLQCQTNLRQLGTAMHAYHENMNNFPINFGAKYDGKPYDPGDTSSYGHSWLTGLLPHLDEQTLYDKIDFKQPLSYPQNTYVAEKVIEIFICPSDRVGDGTLDDRDVPGRWAVTNYKAVAGSNWSLGDYELFPNERPSANSGALIQEQIAYWVGRNAINNDGIDMGNGIICRGGLPNVGAIPTNERDIHDGLSHTIAVGEVIPRYCNKTWWYWWDGATATAAIPMNYFPPQPPPDEDPDGVPEEPKPEEWDRTYSFHSRHLGGMHFLIADGAVKFLSEDIPLELYRDLANIASGQPSAMLPNN